MREEERKKHPSYGLIQFSRVQGNQDFFGTDVKPGSYISLTITEAEENIDLTRSWFFPKKQLLRLRMTNLQFSELITSLNMGSGIPCTLEYIGYTPVEQEREKEYKVDFHKRKTKDMFQNSLNNLKKRASGIEELSKKLPKKDQEDLKNFVSGIIQEFEDNMPFFMECFYEQMENVAQDIKLNLEVDINHKLMTLGFNTANEPKLIEE